MLFLVLACATKSPTPPAPPAVEAAPVEAALPPAAPEAPTQSHMGRHLSQTIIARDSFIHGEIGDARAALAWMAEHEAVEGLPGGAGPFVGQMQAAARAGADANTAAGTALGIAQVGAACGACHAATGARPALPVGAAPPASTDLMPHMARHQWAVGAMWTGLVEPADDAWAAGAAALSDSALPEKAYEVPQVSQAAWADAERAHAAAGEGGDPAKRVQAYATVIAACAGCHAEMRGE